MVGAAGLAILQKYDCEYSTLKCDIQNMPYANWQIAWLCIPLILFGSRFLRFFYRLFKRYVLKKEDRESVTDPRQSWISPFSKVGNRPSSIQPQNNSQVSPEQNNQTSP